jgi:hypothetical protein
MYIVFGIRLLMRWTCVKYLTLGYSGVKVEPVAVDRSTDFSAHSASPLQAYR